MLSFLVGLFRVTSGFMLACLVAGTVTVLFAVTPAELIDADAFYWEAAGGWALDAGTTTAMFALPVAIIPIIFSEVMGIRHFVYHICLGILIALAGFTLIWTSESSDTPSIVNFYAITAFLTTGLFAGLVYWLAAGHMAYRPSTPEVEADTENKSAPPSPSPSVSPASPARVPLMTPPNNMPSTRMQPSQFTATVPPQAPMQTRPKQSDDVLSSPSQPLEKMLFPSLLSRHGKQHPIKKEQNGRSPENTSAQIHRPPSVRKPDD